VVAVLLALVAGFGATRAEAVVGLDPTFGSGGLATAASASAYDEGQVELGIAPDGSSVLTNASAGTAVRFGADGSQDLGYGSSGEVSFSSLTAASPTADELDFHARATAVDDQGRTLIFGETVAYGQSYSDGVAGVTEGSSAMVIRLDAEGQLDQTFGDGKGYIVENFGLHRHVGAHFPTFGVMAGIVDSHDRPVLIAGAKALESGCYAHGGIGQVPVAVVRLTESGTLDPTFGGGDGVSPIKGSGLFAEPAIGLDGADGPVAVVGRTGSYQGECGIGRFVYRLNTDGSRLGSFGTHGFRAFKRLGLDLVEPSGALILSRRHGSTLGIVRIGPDGSRDRTFGLGGVDELRLPSTDGVEPVAVDGQGRILLAGTGYSASPPPAGLSRELIIIGRLLPDGKPDLSFGPEGLLRTHLPALPRISSLGAALDQQGRLLVGATTLTRGGDEPGFLLARFLLE
jgi:uncharacterized delta-60 repeat protein